MRIWLGLAAAIAATAPGVRSTTLLKTSSTWDGAAIAYPRTGSPEVQAVVVELPANGATPIHRHAANNYAYVLEGQVTVEEGEVRRGELVPKKTARFQKGAAFAEVVDTWHRGTAGPDGVKILVWYTGELGQTFTEPLPPRSGQDRANEGGDRRAQPRAGPGADRGPGPPP